MATYIIGDVQGCYRELQALLQKIDFNPDHDQLGFVGDLVNRGPNSLDVLRFIKQLKNPLVVLGNHDLYLLIIGHGLMPVDRYQHTLFDVLAAKDKIDLLDWLQHQSLLYHDANKNFVIVHAGIPPQWTIRDAEKHANEIHDILTAQTSHTFLKNLFGNEPFAWKETLTQQSRWRYITNALTRMRLCTSDGTLDLTQTQPIDHLDDQLRPWFKWRNAALDNVDIFFGHWAVLGGRCDQRHCYALDTGCAWGHQLTAICVENKKRFSVNHIPES